MGFEEVLANDFIQSKKKNSIDDDRIMERVNRGFSTRFRQRGIKEKRKKN